MPDIQQILEELRRLPLTGVVTMQAAQIRRILEYIAELEKKTTS